MDFSLLSKQEGDKMDLSHQNFNCTLSTESLNHIYISNIVGEKLMVLYLNHSLSQTQFSLTFNHAEIPSADIVERESLKNIFPLNIIQGFAKYRFLAIGLDSRRPLLIKQACSQKTL